MSMNMTDAIIEVPKPLTFYKVPRIVTSVKLHLTIAKPL